MLKDLVPAMWSTEELAESLKTLFAANRESCEYFVHGKEYNYDNCSHPRNPCKACNHCNCGFAENPLDVM